MHATPLPPAFRDGLDEFLRHVGDDTVEPPAALADFLAKEKEQTFQQTLWDFIRRDGRPESEIYGAAGLTPSRFSRIRSDREYRPDKITAISLAIALRLSLRNTEELLAAAGFVLSSSNQGDLIVRYCLDNGITDVYRINDALFTYRQPLVCGVVYED